MNDPGIADSERRRSRRHTPKPKTEIVCRSDEALFIGRNLALSILDISADGIRMVVRTSLYAGQKIEVDLEGIGYCKPLQLAAEVVWSVPTADGNWCIGAKF